MNRRVDEDNKITFIPHLDFISSGKFAFPQNDYNISPLSKRVPKGVNAVKVSLGAIGQSCEYDRDLVASILKDVMVKFIQANRQGKEVKIDLRIGFLHAYPNGELQFENKAGGSSEDYDLDAEVMNINNKRYMARRSDKQLNESNLESLARAMSSGAHSVNMKSCF